MVHTSGTLKNQATREHTKRSRIVLDAYETTVGGLSPLEWSKSDGKRGQGSQLPSGNRQKLKLQIMGSIPDVFSRHCSSACVKCG